MLAIIGGYRGMTHYPRLLNSLLRHVTGITELAFVDDSGDSTVVSKLEQWGKVVALPKSGYGPAMQAVCELGSGQPEAVFIEEDFTLTADVDFERLAAARRLMDVGQIVLQRQPWFKTEITAGGLVEACIARGEHFTANGDYLTHKAFFSCNPAVWAQEAFTSGWPEGQWSEDLKRDQMLTAGWEFAITKNVLVHHDGVRSGKGY